MNDKGIIGGVIVLLLAVGAVLYATNGNGTTPGGVAANTPAGAQEFAQCLNSSGATFYGAFWCPHCKEQKAMFGGAASALPYVECSTPDGNSQIPLCKEKNITNYPTWIFKDGSKVTGVQSFAILAEKTGCVDPSAVSVTPSASTTAPTPEAPTPTGAAPTPVPVEPM